MQVVRITRHSADESQKLVLRQKFGEDIEIIEISETMPSESKAFVSRFDELSVGAQIVEAVLPLNLMEAAIKFTAFTKRGGKLIRSVMNRIVNEDGGVTFTFDHYEVVKKVEVLTELL